MIFFSFYFSTEEQSFLVLCSIIILVNLFFIFMVHTCTGAKVDILTDQETARTYFRVYLRTPRYNFENSNGYSLLKLGNG